MDYCGNYFSAGLVFYQIKKPSSRRFFSILQDFHNHHTERNPDEQIDEQNI